MWYSARCFSLLLSVAMLLVVISSLVIMPQKSIVITGDNLL